MLTYSGKVRDGQIVLPQNAALPREADFVIVFNEIPRFAVSSAPRGEGLDKFFAAMDEITDEPITDADLSRLQNNRVSFDRDLGAL